MHEYIYMSNNNSCLQTSATPSLVDWSKTFMHQNILLSINGKFCINKTWFIIDTSFTRNFVTEVCHVTSYSCRYVAMLLLAHTGALPCHFQFPLYIVVFHLGLTGTLSCHFQFPLVHCRVPTNYYGYIVMLPLVIYESSISYGPK